MGKSGERGQTSEKNDEYGDTKECRVNPYTIRGGGAGITWVLGECKEMEHQERKRSWGKLRKKEVIAEKGAVMLFKCKKHPKLRKDHTRRGIKKRKSDGTK